MLILYETFLYVGRSATECGYNVELTTLFYKFQAVRIFASKNYVPMLLTLKLSHYTPRRRFGGEAI
jgi:hypothetical protein